MGLNESLLFCFEVLPWNDKTTRETGNFRDDFSQKTNDDGCELRRQSLRRRNKRWKNCSSQQAGIKFLATVQFKLKPKEQNSFNFMQIVCTSAMKGKINFVFRYVSPLVCEHNKGEGEENLEKNFCFVSGRESCEMFAVDF